MLENNKKIEISRQFCQEVKELAKKYNLPFFVVTDGASATSNNGCAAVKNARDNHIKWEKENGYDPYEDWSTSGF
jgi:pyruvate/2-oxoacid:ferredoxin oxidoreductase alpha subunit